MRATKPPQAPTTTHEIQRDKRAGREKEPELIQAIHDLVEELSDTFTARFQSGAIGDEKGFNAIALVNAFHNRATSRDGASPLLVAEARELTERYGRAYEAVRNAHPGDRPPAASVSERALLWLNPKLAGWLWGALPTLEMTREMADHRNCWRETLAVAALTNPGRKSLAVVERIARVALGPIARKKKFELDDLVHDVLLKITRRKINVRTYQPRLAATALEAAKNAYLYFRVELVRLANDTIAFRNADCSVSPRTLRRVTKRAGKVLDQAQLAQALNENSNAQRHVHDGASLNALKVQLGVTTKAIRIAVAKAESEGPPFPRAADNCYNFRAPDIKRLLKYLRRRSVG